MPPLESKELRILLFRSLIGFSVDFVSSVLFDDEATCNFTLEIGDCSTSAVLFKFPVLPFGATIVSPAAG